MTIFLFSLTRRRKIFIFFRGFFSPRREIVCYSAKIPPTTHSNTCYRFFVFYLNSSPPLYLFTDFRWPPGYQNAPRINRYKTDYRRSPLVYSPGIFIYTIRGVLKVTSSSKLKYFWCSFFLRKFKLHSVTLNSV